MPAGFPSRATSSSSPPTPPPPSPDPPAPQPGWAPRTGNPPPSLLRAANTPCPNLLLSTSTQITENSLTWRALCPHPSGHGRGSAASAAPADWVSHRLAEHQRLPLVLPSQREPFLPLFKESSVLCSSAVSERGGSWQPRSGNLPFWAAALLDGGDGSDLSLAMCKGYKPYSDPSQDVPPPLMSQDPPGCPGAGPRAVPAPALPWLQFARAPRAADRARSPGPAGAGCGQHGSSASGAAASCPGTRRGQAAGLHQGGQRGPLTANRPNLPCCPSGEDVCPAAASERGGSTGRVPPALAFLLAQGQGAVGIRGLACPAAAASGCPRGPG